MATNPATYTDVEGRWRPLSDNERLIAATLLDDAFNLIVNEDPTIDTRLDAETLAVGLVRQVLAQMVMRVLKNPDGIRQESIQDYSQTRDDNTASGLLMVTDAELDLLAADDTQQSDAFTIRPAYQIPAGSSTYDASDWEWA